MRFLTSSVVTFETMKLSDTGLNSIKNALALLTFQVNLVDGCHTARNVSPRFSIDYL